jgi:hypothetical protein
LKSAESYLHILGPQIAPQRGIFLQVMQTLHLLKGNRDLCHFSCFILSLIILHRPHHVPSKSCKVILRKRSSTVRVIGKAIKTPASSPAPDFGYNNKELSTLKQYERDLDFSYPELEFDFIRMLYIQLDSPDFDAARLRF